MKVFNCLSSVYRHTFRSQIRSTNLPSNRSTKLKASTFQGDLNIERNHFDKMDHLQTKCMQEEMCILVDETDRVIGQASKEECHLMKNINTGMLHRAFSVLLFNSKNECLLTQRASTKITFPNFYTNACCSHPLSNELEMDEQNAIGIRRAAQRRLNDELGIKETDAPINDFIYLTRIHYKAASNGQTWGEHEIDYILILKKDVEIKPNPNEVSYVQFLNKDEFRLKIDQAKRDKLVTPWFVGIHDKFLYSWWNNLDNLEKFKDHKKIHRLDDSQ